MIEYKRYRYRQTKTTDFLYTAGSGKVTFKDALIPDGLVIQITSFNPPT